MVDFTPRMTSMCGKALHTHWFEKWTSPRADFDVVERGIPSSCGSWPIPAPDIYRSPNAISIVTCGGDLQDGVCTE
jgi:hypothetical protein